MYLLKNISVASRVCTSDVVAVSRCSGYIRFYDHRALCCGTYVAGVRRDAPVCTLRSTVRCVYEQCHARVDVTSLVPKVTDRSPTFPMCHIGRGCHPWRLCSMACSPPNDLKIDDHREGEGADTIDGRDDLEGQLGHESGSRTGG